MARAKRMRIPMVLDAVSVSVWLINFGFSICTTFEAE